MAKKKRIHKVAASHNQPKEINYEDPRQVQKRMSEMVWNYINCANELTAGQAYIAQSFDLSGPWLSRRAKAVSHYTSCVQARYGKQYPDFDLQADFLKLNVLPISNYDELDRNGDISLAAAIWILDHLKKSGTLAEGIACLPADVPPDTVKIPPVYDPCYPEDVLRRMVYVIQDRNTDLREHTKKNSGRLNKRPEPVRHIMDMSTAQGKWDCPSHQRYRAILDLISSDAKETAVKHFQEKIFAWSDLYYPISARLDQEMQKILSEVYHLYDVMLLDVNTEQRAEQPTGTALKKAPAQQKLQLQSVQTSLSPITLSKNTRFATLDSPYMKMGHIFRQLEPLEDQRKKLLRQQRTFRLWAISAHDSSEDTLVDVLDDKTLTQFRSFTVEDPYEICFALFYLIELDEDLPWIYYFSQVVLKTALMQLPWTPSHCQTEQHDSLALTFDSTWYQMRYHSLLVQDTPEDTVQPQLNLAQIVYQLTGGILPRNLNCSVELVQSLQRCGVSEQMLPGLQWVVSLLQAGQGCDLPSLDHPVDATEDKCKPELQAIAGETQNLQMQLDLLRSENAKLKQENRRLKGDAYEVQRTVRESEERYEKLLAQMELEHQELADLRELVFKRETESYQEEAPVEKITFPYETQHRIVVFGGHESWAREIKPKLPNVRFIDRETTPNAEVIRHADVVWIQPNALAHKYFYKIIDEVRRYHIPIRYLAYVSATKCAEQIVEEDKK